MVIDEGEVDLDAIERVDLGLQLVVTRQQRRPEGPDHAGQLRLELLQIHHLPPLLGEGQQLEFAVDPLGHRPLVGEIHTVRRHVTSGHRPEVFEVREPDLVHARRLPVDPQHSEVPADRPLIHAQVRRDFLLSWHLNPYVYDPPSPPKSSQNRRSSRPLRLGGRRDPGNSGGPGRFGQRCRPSLARNENSRSRIAGKA